MFTQEQIAAIVAALQTALQGLAVPAATPVPAAVQQAPVAPAAPAAGSFNEWFYRNRYPDVDKAIRDGAFKSALQHYQLHGAAEGREFRLHGEAAAPAPVPAPTPVRQVSFSLDKNNWRIDDIVPPGTPGTVTLPRTGHTLSLPQPNPADPTKGEMFIGYLGRVWKQAGATAFPTGLGALFLGFGSLFQPGRPWDKEGTHWPEAADAYYNQAAYSDGSAANRLKAQSDQQWAEWEAAKKAQAAGKQGPKPVASQTEEVVIQ